MLRIILLSYTKRNYILVSSFKLVIFVCLAIPSYGQAVVGITDSDVIMNWTITDNNVDGPRTVSTPNGQAVFFFPSGSIFPSTSSNYAQRTVYLGDLSRSIVSFNLSRLKVEDAGRYTFMNNSMIFGGQILVMAVSPSQPVVTEIVAAVMGSDYKLNCFALSRSEPSNHGMIMTSEWKINGVSVSTSGRYTVQNTELTITGLIRQDHDKQVTCVAYEDQRAKSVESVPFVINVKSQVVAGIPGGEVVMNWTITDNNAENPRTVSNPNSQAVFFFPSGSIYPLTSLNYIQRTVYLGDLSSSIVSFNLSRLKVEDAGRYTFKILSMIIRGQVLVMAVPPLQPVVTEIVPAVLGSDYKLNCFALSRSEPSNHGMIMTSEWKINGTSVATSGRYTVQNTELTITELTRQDHDKQVTCVAYEDQRAKSVESVPFGICVKFGPDNVQLSPSDASVVAEKYSIRITCNADCNPSCYFFWRRSSSVTTVSTSQTLFFGKVTRSDADTYTCYISNSVTRRNSSLNTTITVIYGAEIKDFSVQGGTTVNENESATFQCSVDSYPKSTITLKRESDGTILKTEVDALQSQYWFQSANCLDTDNYTCSASNNISQPAVKTIQFFVKCHPRLDFRAPFENITYSKHLGDAVLRYTVISYPPPRFTWAFLGNGSESRGLPNSAIQSDYGHQSEVRFTKLDVGDFGSYRVIADNTINEPATAVLWLLFGGTPGKPLNFHGTNIQEKQLSLRWQSGYNGGFTQTFVAEISHDNITWNNVSQVRAGNRDGWFSTIVGDLIPGSEYYLRLYAYNIHGRGDFADVQFVIRILKESACPSSLEVGASAGIGVGGAVGFGVGGIVLGLIAAIIAFTIRRQLNGPTNSYYRSKGKTNEEMHPYSNTEMNPQTVKPIYEKLNKGNTEQTVYDKISPLEG